MSAIDRVKKLLAAAEDDRTCDDQYGPFRGGCDECGRYSNKGSYAAKRALGRAGFASVGTTGYPAAQALVESQEALEKVAQVECDDLIHFSLVDDPENCDPACIRCPVEAALRMNGLEKAMEEK